MRLAFAGTPEFAAQALAALLDAGHEITLVLTQPDRRAGRGMRVSESAVKRLARERSLPIAQPETLRDEAALATLAAARPEALVVAAYGLILPERALTIAPRGALNIHASLLPRWRGAAPIQRALLAGDRETGISIMQMDAGLDTGPVLSRQAIPIRDDDDAQTLHDRLAALGAQMIVAALKGLAVGNVLAEAQANEQATYAAKLVGADTVIDWSRPAEELERMIRALRPNPGAQTTLRGGPLKLWRARCVAGEGMPGVILDSNPHGLTVACGAGALQVSEMQRAGGRRLVASEFLRGTPLSPGEQLGAAR